MVRRAHRIDWDATAEFDCAHCKSLKKPEEFNKRTPTAANRRPVQNLCRLCQKGYAAGHWGNTEHRQKKKDYSRWYKYNLTKEEFAKLKTEQGGYCKLCKKPEPANRELCVDHCHATGRVRGLLCLKCNSAIGQLGDDEAGLQKALQYIQGVSA